MKKKKKTTGIKIVTKSTKHPATSHAGSTDTAGSSRGLPQSPDPESASSTANTDSFKSTTSTNQSSTTAPSAAHYAKQSQGQWPKCIADKCPDNKNQAANTKFAESNSCAASYLHETTTATAATP